MGDTASRPILLLIHFNICALTYLRLEFQGSVLLSYTREVYVLGAGGIFKNWTILHLIICAR